MGARSVPSFAAAAGAAPQPAGFPNAPNSSSSPAATASGDPISGGSTPAPSTSGVPRAILPALAEAGLGSGEGSGGGFDLSSAPMRPAPQRLAFGVNDSAATLTGPPRFGGPASSAFENKNATPHWAADFGGSNGESGASLPRPDQIMDLKPLGQVSASFIIAVNGAGLWIVDQHVAHERVLFEQHLSARRAGKVESQRMLMPVVIDLSPRQIVIFEKIAEELAANGFEVEPMGPKSFALQAVPAGVLASDAEQLLTEILDGLGRENAAISIDTLQAKIAASTACHAAIKINMPLDQTKMEWLLGALAKTDCPMSCPHGRPVVLRYSIKEIEKAFHRI
jgi:DNA mismatch repair protein MutL